MNYRMTCSCARIIHTLLPKDTRGGGASKTLFQGFGDKKNLTAEIDPPALQGVIWSGRRCHRTIRLSILLLAALACNLSFFATAASAQHQIDRAPTHSRQPKSGEKGYTFEDFITVGDDDAVKCVFKVISPASHYVQIGDSACAIPKTARGAVHLPETVTDRNGDHTEYTVTEIEAYAFSGCANISDTGLGSNTSIESLGYNAFENCTSLTSTGLESNHSVASLYYSFRGCTGLTSTGLGSNDKIKVLEGQDFFGCTGLTSTGLESNHKITTLGYDVFRGCTSLTSTGLESNSTVTKLDKNEFTGCTALTSTGLASNSKISSIPNEAFSGCTGLTSTGLESNGAVTELGESVFSGCTGLTSTGLDSNDTLETWGSKIFFGCTALESTGLASNGRLSSISDDAFNGCTSLTSTGLASNRAVTDIGKNAFFKCVALSSTELDSNAKVARVGDHSFENCSSLTSTGLAGNASVTDIGAYAFHQCSALAGTGLDGATAVQKIGDYAFAQCDRLTSTGLAGNASVTDIGAYAFHQCSALEGTGLGGATAVQKIGAYAFEKCGRLTSSSLAGNASVTVIGEYAFHSCPLLRSTDLPEAKAVRELGICAFAECPLLESTGLGSNKTVEKVGFGCFQNDTLLTSTGFETNSKVTRMPDNIFSGCTRLSSTGLASNTSLTNVGALAFESCSSLTSTGLEHNDTVSALGECAFSGCSALETTGLESNATVDFIGEYVFEECTSLTSTGLESNHTLVTLGYAMFLNCTSLTSTGLTNNHTVRKIGTQCFEGCTSLGSVPDSTGQANAGDLVLNAPDDGGKLTVQYRVFRDTKFTNLFLRGKPDQFIFFDTCFDNTDQLKTAYVPASWSGTATWSGGGKTFGTQNGSLVIMDPVLRDASAARTQNTSDQAVVTLTVNTGMTINISGETSGTVVSGARVDPGGVTPQPVEVPVPAGSGLLPSADELTISLASPLVYPAGQPDRTYNRVEGHSITCAMPAVRYRIGFDANEGEGTIPDQDMVYDEPAELSALADRISREGFDFTGWNMSADGSGRSFADGARVENLTKKEGGVVRLYAQWKESVSLPLVINCHVLGAGGASLGGCGITLSSTPDGTGAIAQLYTDEAKQRPVESWPLKTGADGNLRLYGVSSGTYYILNPIAPAGFQPRSGVPAVFEVDRKGNVSVAGGDFLPPEGGVIRIGLGFEANPTLPGAGGLARYPLAAAGVVAVMLAAAHLATRRAARL